MFKDLLINNRSYRAYDRSYSVSKEELMELIHTARFSPSARNQQGLKFKLFTGVEADKMQGLYKLGGALPELKLPRPETAPNAFILVCIDEKKAKNDKYIMMDVGIISHSILLRASELGLGGIMIGAAHFEKIVEEFSIPDRYAPVLLLAVGKPMEKIIIKDINDNEARKYYREDGVHTVPKVIADNLII